MTVTDASFGHRSLTATVRVLVVDDVPDIRKLIRMTLERCGPFDVVGEAGDGEQAIHEAKRLQPDIVLLDLSMPVMDGLEALPAILAASPESKVLVLSGFTAGEMSDEALRRGAAGYMEKGGIVGKLGPRLRELVPFRAVTFDDRDATPPAPPPLAGDLVALLIRDLSRPLTVLHALASRLLHADELPPDAVRSALDAITREARQLESILETFGDTHKIEVGGLDLALSPTNLPQLVRDCIAELADITSSHPVSVDLEDRIVLNIDPMRIRHVIATLLSNAARFSPYQSPIEVSSLVDETTVEVRVRDHGNGIGAHDQDKIFKKFGRVDPDAVGTGLGLYISREIARAHGGDVFLASCDDTGCVFALRLHINPDH